VQVHGADHGGGVLFPYRSRFDDVGENDAEITLWRRCAGGKVPSAIKGVRLGFDGAMGVANALGFGFWMMAGICAREWPSWMWCVGLVSLDWEVENASPR
jgi:hypothetical protein